MTQSSVSILDAVLSDLIASCGAANSDEIGAARNDFDTRRGKVFEDEELWERWTRSFLEWYVLERPTGPNNVPPVAIAMQNETDPERTAHLQAWLTSHRSVFEVLELGEGRAELLDIVGGARFSVSEKRVLHGVLAKDIVEARLVGVAGEVHFGRTFCFHPRGIEGSIRRIATGLQNKGTPTAAILDQLANLRVRCTRYKHLKPARIYKEYADKC